jgi:hypothetical protein
MADNLLRIQPGKYLTRGGRYVDIHSQQTMGGGQIKFWHGFILSHFSHRGGSQGAWDENGENMGDDRSLDLVEPAYSNEDAQVM